MTSFRIIFQVNACVYVLQPALQSRAEVCVPTGAAALAGGSRCGPQPFPYQQGPFTLESPKAQTPTGALTDSVQPGSHGRVAVTHVQPWRCWPTLHLRSRPPGAPCSAPGRHTHTRLAPPARCTPGPVITCAISHLVYKARFRSGTPRNLVVCLVLGVLDAHTSRKCWTVVLMPGRNRPNVLASGKQDRHS